ncbi:MAG TPA: hypothetical protein VNA25_01500 [Phycisphaerae bacterium]|nr:hypothetical protein [Phycisphaerae bacterium]
MTFAPVHRVLLISLWGLLASTAPGALGADGGSSASQPADAQADAAARLSQFARRRVAALAGRNERQARQARQQLVALQRALIDSLAPHADDADLEVRLRVRSAMNDCCIECRLVRILAYLPPASHDQLRQFRRSQPEILDKLLSHNASHCASALRSISPKTDPNGLAEPLMALMLRHPVAPLAAEAALAAARCEYRSPGVIEGLDGMMERFRNYHQTYDHRNVHEAVPPFDAAMIALRAIGGPATTPVLLRQLNLARNQGDTILAIKRSALTAEALVATGDKRAIDPLVQSLESGGGRWWLWRARERDGNTSPDDHALHVAMRLTGQSLDSYRMIQVKGFGFVHAAFLTGADRRAAYKKMRKWWSDHRNLPPYKGVQPLRVPARGRTISPTAAGAAPADGPTADDEPPPKIDAELAALIRRQAGKAVEAFGAEGLARRTQGHEQVLALQRALLAPLSDPPADANDRLHGLLLQVLADITTETNYLTAIAAMPADQRSDVRAVGGRLGGPDAVRDLYAPNWRRRLAAIQRIVGMPDPNGLAEPLIIAALQDIHPAVALPAAEALANGCYHSDELLNVIVEAFARLPSCHWHYGTWEDPQMKLLWAMRRGLAKARNPRALPVLLAILNQRHDRSVDPAERTAYVLASTGEKRLIPSMIDMLEDTRIRLWSGGDERFTIARSDIALMVMVNVSGQREADYGFVYDKFPSGPVFGFADAKARREAIAKFRQWWQTHKDTPEYRDLKPLPAFALPPPQRGDRPAPKGS